MRLKQLLTITPNAIDKLLSIKKSNNCEYINFTLKSGGCNGFNYNLIPTNDKPHKYDELIKVESLKVYVNNSDLIYLLGTKIDWEEGIMGSMFTFDNPNADSKCGCGKSFNPS